MLPDHSTLLIQFTTLYSDIPLIQLRLCIRVNNSAHIVIGAILGRVGIVEFRVSLLGVDLSCIDEAIETMGLLDERLNSTPIVAPKGLIRIVSATFPYLVYD